MTGIEKITGRILADAQAEVDATLHAAESEAASIRAKFEAQARREAEEILRRGRERAEERERNLAGTAQLEARKDTLAAKQAVLDRAFTLAQEQLCALPRAEYTAFLASLAARSSYSGTESIVLSPEDRDSLGETVVKSANERLAREGRPAGLTLAPDTRPTGGGLLLREGNIETNCTFETLLRLIRNKISGEVAAVLFG